MRPLSFILGALVGTILSAAIVSAWAGPTATAPGNNVSAPINVGSTAQIKNGSLGVNSLAVYGNQILSGSGLYLNFGSTAGSGGYGIWDNAGTLEFKNSGGSWNNFTNSVLNVLGAGAVTTLEFADGSTQTTAATTSKPKIVIGSSIQVSGQCPAGYIAVGVENGCYQQGTLSCGSRGGCTYTSPYTTVCSASADCAPISIQ